MVWVVSLSTTEVSSRRLTPVKQLTGIRSLVGFGTLVGALVHPVLYHQRRPPKAAPKSISRRTSNHEV